MTITSTIYASQGVCEKCGLPFMYVGDPIGDLTGIICTCGRKDKKNPVVYKFTTVPITLDIPSNKKESNECYLERIALALEYLIRILETGNAKIRNIK